ncbi:MAG: acyltransferase [Candidatus Thiocaldithrix dubininis]|uniref:Acyltransferase n=1 Tax=Candidatus Thiocaldithrix dubininis TaxID=3080823 RepID=A0AA95KFE9_9GAMM|nr:MAG: acyltransferase [Candidatus Thiocaldithrix dubininis]
MKNQTYVKKWQKALDFSGKVLAYLPYFIRNFLYSMALPYESKLALAIKYLVNKLKLQYLGNNVYFGSNITIKNHHLLTIGNNVSIHSNAYIDAAGSINIGDNVSIAHQTSILSAEHTWQDKKIPIKYNPVNLKPTIIEDDVWIGCGVRILAGVTIKTRSIVAAGAVVTKDVESDIIVGGIPAKPIKKII